MEKSRYILEAPNMGVSKGREPGKDVVLDVGETDILKPAGLQLHKGGEWMGGVVGISTRGGEGSMHSAVRTDRHASRGPARHRCVAGGWVE